MYYFYYCYYYHFYYYNNIIIIIVIIIDYYWLSVVKTRSRVLILYRWCVHDDMQGVILWVYFVLMLLWKWWLWSCVYYCFIIIHIFFYKLFFTTREMLVIQWEKFYNRPSRWQSCIFIALFVQLAFLEGKKKKHKEELCIICL